MCEYADSNKILHGILHEQADPDVLELLLECLRDF